MSEEMAEYKVVDKRLMSEPPEPVPIGPNAVIMMAMQKNLSPELIEKMMALQERYEANEARKAYHEAMAAFKASPPEIEKDKKVGYTPLNKPEVKYSHASLANVTGKINAALSKHGLSAAWKTEQTEKGITVTCTITHRLGHSESTSLTSGPDTTGSKNAIQAVGSTITYLERYTLLALTGLATHDMDDDGTGAVGTEFITDEQRIEIEKIILEKNIDQAQFLSYMKVETTQEILATDYQKALQTVKKAKGRPKE